MSEKLIKHLQSVCDGNSSVKILMSQWNFDSLLVSKALENISSYYPHFSNHNVSHSNQILVNIERLLGDDIGKLSATDTWLILEAAYWHDIGMLIDAKSAKDLQHNDDFKFMVRQIASDKSHDLHRFAKIFDEQGWSVAVGDFSDPFDGVEKYRQLIAEWFRSKHAKRVGSIIEDPFKDLGINSPRTELLPKRLYRYLGQICMAHGSSFEKMMADLPYKQTGLGTENCHPRFVACLLRLGDLFDLDDNRFCPVMHKHVGDMPSLSDIHAKKHLSIREFQLDRDTVKIVAECPDEVTYVETQTWFNWIRKEFECQMSSWKFIVPNRNFGLLPTLEQLEVRVKGNKILLDAQPMRFSLDEQNAIEILEGSGIYKNDTNVYRELIQNSIDATLIRVWLQHGKNGIDVEKIPTKSHPFDKTTQEILKKYPLFVDFKKVKDIENSDYALWEFTLKDHGVGISLEDLKYMQKIAGSSRNIERQKIIETMPKWMQPSGQFGIGLHSAFLLMKDLDDQDQKIVMITTNVKDHKTYKIEMYSPLCKKKGYCFIEEIISEKTIKNVGTELKVNLKIKRRGLIFNNDSKIYSNLYRNHDPLKEEIADFFSVSFDVENILLKVLSNKFISVNFGDFWEKNIKIVYGDGFLEKNNKKQGLWLDKYQIYIDFDSNETNLSQRSGAIYAGFKGQPVGRISYYDPVFDFYIMFYSLKAKESLQANRNEWRNEFLSLFWNKKELDEICQYLIDFYPEKIEEILRNNIKEISLFYKRFSSVKQYKYPNEWKKISVFDVQDSYKYKNQSCLLYGKSFEYLMNEKEFFILTVDSYNEFDTSSFSKASDIIIPNHFYGWIRDCFNEEWISQGGEIIEQDFLSSPMSIQGIKYIKNSEISSSSEEHKILLWIKSRIGRQRKRLHFNNEWSVFDFFSKYKVLFIKTNLTERMVGLDFKEKILILPFLFDLSKDHKIIKKDFLDDEKLISEVWNNRDDEFIEMSFEQIKSLYNDLVNDIDRIMEVDPIWKEARNNSKTL